MNVRLLIFAIAALCMLGSAIGADEGKATASRKKILVELYTSQGCDSCPPAADLLGRLKAMGYGRDKVVPIAFHVDYFNDPWKDPFSDPDFSRRQMSYNSVQKRDDLYFTPMMMVDGRYPMLGSNQPEALAAIKKSLAEKATVSLKLTCEGGRESRTLSVELAADAKGNGPVGRELLVGVAVTEDPVTTDVPSGENAGKTLVEHHAVRSFAYKIVRLPRSGSTTLTFPIKPAADWTVERCSLAVFAQDRLNGKVYQADAIPWETKEAIDATKGAGK